MTVARRGHPYPNVRLAASDLVNLSVATLPRGARATDGLALATRLNAAALAVGAGARRFVLREDLNRAVTLGLGELTAHRLVRPLPVVTPHASEIVVRRHLASGAPLVIVRDEAVAVGAVGRTGFSVQAGHSLKDRFTASFPPEVCALLARIGGLAEAQGGRAFAVGGVVRHVLLPPNPEAVRVLTAPPQLHAKSRAAPGPLGSPERRGAWGALSRPPMDLDVVVEGDGLAVARLLAAELHGALVEHARFLTASVQSEAGQRVDIATARAEGYEMPGALPRVRPAEIAEDLRRRDFSVNGMAAELSSGAFLLVDPLGGQNDLRRRRLRIVHPLSFVEDPTRIFRAARYGARLDLAPDPWTAACLDLAIELAPYTALSGQRIVAELELILREPRAATALATLGTVGAFRLLDRRYRYTHVTAARLADLDALRAWAAAHSVPASPLELLLLAVLGDQAPHITRTALERLGLSGEGGQRLGDVLGRAGSLGEALRATTTRSAAARLLRGRPGVELAWLWLGGDTAVRREVTRFLDHDARVEPWLGGDEVMALGIARGPGVAQILEALRDGRLDGTITDRAAAELHVRRQAGSPEASGPGRAWEREEG
jgi:tRNA nucleotidyltransferase/poly(A) polymerase